MFAGTRQAGMGGWSLGGLVWENCGHEGNPDDQVPGQCRRGPCAGWQQHCRSQNERDYAALQAAVKDGKAEAATEI
jgi:hypothetical protein